MPTQRICEAGATLKQLHVKSEILNVNNVSNVCRFYDFDIELKHNMAVMQINLMRGL
jgi:hypothetical protein